jgi:hypothetical protein
MSSKIKTSQQRADIFSQYLLKTLSFQIPTTIFYASLPTSKGYVYLQLNKYRDVVVVCWA